MSLAIWEHGITILFCFVLWLWFFCHPSIQFMKCIHLPWKSLYSTRHQQGNMKHKIHKYSTMLWTMKRDIIHETKRPKLSQDNIRLWTGKDACIYNLCLLFAPVLGRYQLLSIPIGTQIKSLKKTHTSLILVLHLFCNFQRSSLVLKNPFFNVNV